MEATQVKDEHFERLVNCFENVFAGLSRSAIPEASQDTVSGWDSVAHITLVSLIAEEFGIDVDFDDFAGVTSFAAILDLVRQKAG